MGFHQFAVATLLAVSGVLGVEPIAHELHSWQVTQPWQGVLAADGSDRGFMQFAAISTEIPNQCLGHPDDYIAFPAIIHGSQVISVDDHVILQFGDPTFATMRSFYGQPVIKCKDLHGGQKLQWEAYSYTKYFARISYFPTLSPHGPIYNVFAETFHIIGAGAGILMAIFAFTMFAGKVSRKTTLSVCGSSFFSSFYLGGCVAGFMGFSLKMLSVHKIADIGVWISISLLVNALRYEGLISKKVTLTFVGSVILASIIILLGDTGDLVQFGTTIPFVFTLVVLSVPMLVLARNLSRAGRDRRMLLQFFSLGSFVLAVFNEMFAVTGLIHSSPMLPFGFMSGMMFLALSVNERINETYRERDYLRSNLEHEVERKTAELQKKTSLLESAMTELKLTQAELVQSAKLASLGTLSAGIAHEINNSLNYVNGAMQPLERLIEKVAAGNEAKVKIDKLFNVMREGLQLTIEIIKSLRSHAGLNQAKFNDVDLAEAMQSSLTILRSRIREKIEVRQDIPSGSKVFASVVGLNQVFMNLISNALDAMPSGGTLSLSCSELADEHVEIIVRDTGTGIEDSLRDRIFEPFFTTKEIGKGTGLGLHIVRAEVEKHGGRIRVESTLGVGTAFYITIPKIAKSSDQRGAA